MVSVDQCRQSQSQLPISVSFPEITPPFFLMSTVGHLMGVGVGLSEEMFGSIILQ